MTAESCDVVVVGAGPAGATVATRLAQAGHDVRMLEKSGFPRYRIGESLLPATVRDLADLLGLRDTFAEAGFVDKRGATFSWGRQPETLWSLNFGGERSAEPELAPETPAAFNVPRDRFDQLLVDNAVSQGVSLHTDCQVTRPVESDGRVTGVEYRDADGTSHQLSARYVVDAAGQRSPLAKQVSPRRLSTFFAKVAVWGYYEGGQRLPAPFAGNVLFQTVGRAWVWYIPLDDKLTSVGVVLPVEERRAGQSAEALLNERIEGCPLLREYLEDAHPSTREPWNKVRTCSEYSYAHDSFWKPGLALVGDSACFVDVLLSSGVHLATWGALLAARSLHAALSGELEEDIALNEYEARLRHEFALFHDGLVGLYDMEQDADTYGTWLRSLLDRTHGIAMREPTRDQALLVSRNTWRLQRQVQRNVDTLRAYNRQQLDYDGEACQTTEVVPELLPTLIASDDRHSWIRLR